MPQVNSPELRVPEYVQRGLKILADLTDESSEELLTVLSEEKASLSSRDMSRRVTAKIPGANRKDIRDIVETLLSMHRARQEYGMSTDTLVSDMTLDTEGLGISESQQKQLRERLPNFLRLDLLAVTAKAFSVMGSHERVVLKTQILTDIRPVFGENDSEKPEAAAIIHTLRITYRQDGEEMDFFAAMDTEDVHKLRDVLERADKKAAGVQALLEAAKVPYLEVSGENSGS